MYMDIYHPKQSEKAPPVISPDEIKSFKQIVRELIAPDGMVCFSSTEGKKILKKKGAIVYNMLVSTDEEMSHIDIAINKSGRIEFYIVFPSTELIDTHYYQAAFIFNCLLKAGFKVLAIHLVYVNKNYVRNGEITSDYLIVENATLSLVKMLPRIKKKNEHFKNVLSWDAAPDIAVGAHCLKPILCERKRACWPQEVQTNSIFDLRGLRTTRKLGYYYKDIISFEQLIAKDVDRLTDAQILQIKSTLENKIAYRPELISAWLKDILQYDQTVFLDIETIAPILPVAEGLKSFARIPFQFSLHVLNNSTKEVKHYEFLANPRKSLDTRLQFAEALVQAMKHHKNAKTIVYNKTFEYGIISSLMNQFSKYSGLLKLILSNVVDMMEIFRNNWYYDKRFGGSYSLKAIAPVLCPEISYSNLEINNGLKAGLEYQRLTKCDNDTAVAIRQSLLTYCKADTESLVGIFLFLTKFIKENYPNN
jgi:hypothetical protein